MQDKQMENEEEQTKERLTKSILSALKLLYKNDRVLVELKANERCIAARVFAYIMSQANSNTNGLVWDAEYNRKGLQGDPKDMGGGKRLNKIIPDLVLHHRGYDDRNVLVCEFKKKSTLKVMQRSWHI